jgi:hypothetical protein
MSCQSMSHLLRVLDDLEGLPRAKAAHANVILLGSRRGDGIHGRRVAQHLRKQATKVHARTHARTYATKPPSDRATKPEHRKPQVQVSERLEVSAATKQDGSVYVCACAFSFRRACVRVLDGGLSAYWQEHWHNASRLASARCTHGVDPRRRTTLRASHRQSVSQSLSHSVTHLVLAREGRGGAVREHKARVQSRVVGQESRQACQCE